MSETKEAKKEVLKQLSGSDVGDNDILPEKLRLYVSQEIWSGWSPIRRESFKQIIKNPNSFFYRNRPPGDPQKYGRFTPEEEKQFIERLKYFRQTLKIEDGLWGLFSVPLRGRLGYQCSNFYRQLIRDGKIKDSRYSTESDGKLHFSRGSTAPAPPESIRILENEAFEFIKQSISSEDGSIPVVSAPIQIDSSQPTRFKQTQFRTNTSRQSGSPTVNSLSHLFGKRRKNLSEKKYDPNRGELDSDDKEEKQPKPPKNTQLDRCPLCGAIDPMTNEPIKTPMMDLLGFVMDLNSWRRVFRYGEQPPCSTVAESENDLIQITPLNFEQLRLLVSNFAC
ncbi:Myb-like DNA-binding domain containing protein [Histomonas meleagridis]|uniref:Myb-like DNA-binding domain containing protein n=1 Tax=Histomonas meleagridis TaxID=135588 RepID=UPI003559A795|nr:Myb-like DNA-binding domain containing protein [Histomonas meleagridis]KAH0798574.1 Myb-like DNA-binding domain containing protein [Histomonas meleagridis]